VRRQLTITAAAVASMIVLAFVIPLGLLVRQLVEDRALRGAEQRAAALVPVLATVNDRNDIQNVVDGLDTGEPASMTVVLADGTVLGHALPPDASRDVDLVRSQRSSFTIDEVGGVGVYLPVVTAGEVDVVRAFVPDAVRTRGVGSAWLLLGLLGVVLVAAATALADRLGRSVVGPVRELAHAAERLGAGDLTARVEPDGPPEIAEVGETMNRLAGRIDELLAAERETVADLSHRLRTPITALKLDAEAVTDLEERARLMDDVESLQRAVTQVINDARRVEGAAPPEVDLVATTRERVAFWSALAEDQGRRWELDLPEGPLRVAVSGADLGAALDALLGNVLAHTPDEVPFRVAVRAVDETGFRGGELVVEDDGPGFPAGDPTQRGRSEGGSTGLGLDIVVRTAAAAHGSVEVGASPAGGARVLVRLPAA